MRIAIYRPPPSLPLWYHGAHLVSQSIQLQPHPIHLLLTPTVTPTTGTAPLPLDALVRLHHHSLAARMLTR